MEISRQKIITTLWDLWPDLVDGLPSPTNIAIPRGRYWAPTRQQFENMINADYSSVAKYTHYVTDLYACTNFAATLAVISDFYVLQLLALNQLRPENRLEWAIGEVWGTRFRGKETSHAIAGVFLDIDSVVELWLLEPQPNRSGPELKYQAWKADSEQDKVHFFKL